MRFAKGALLIVISAFAQGADHPAFDVATIRMYHSDTPFQPEFQGFTASADGIRAIHVTLRGCLQWAYQIVDVSGPAWITEESYDIVAKAPGPVSGVVLQQMLQTLLEERFKLTLHRENRKSLTGVLIVGKNGIKNLMPVESTAPTELKRSKGILELKNASMSRIAGILGSPFGNMPLEKIVDQTGLEGLYNITLDLHGFDPKDPEFAGRYVEMRTALFVYVSAALEKKYGLKLERRNLPVERLFVDNGNKIPIEN